MSTPIQTQDGLRNAITGAGTSRDPATQDVHCYTELSQGQITNAVRSSGILRKIVNIGPLDMVREWREWEGLEPEQVTAITDLERKLGIRKKVRQAEVLRNMGGGALILGLPGDPLQPATGGELAFVHVVSRWHLHFDRLIDDATDPLYGEPEMWKLRDANSREIHPSRVIPFRADNTTMIATSYGENTNWGYWGDSMVSHVLQAVNNNDSAHNAFRALVHKARLLRIGIPKLLETVSTKGGEELVQGRLATLSMAESIFNAVIYDTGNGEDSVSEEIQDTSYSFAGAKDILNAFGEFLAAVSDVPVTRLLGRAPEGMNSSGDSQQKDWNKKIRGLQELDLAPCLDKLDAFLLPTAGLSVDTAKYDFAPLEEPNEKDRSERFERDTNSLDKLSMMNVMPEEAFNRAAQSKLIDGGYLPGLEGILEEYSDEERFGIGQGDIDEDPLSVEPE